jgi:branched-chain amino acid transport system substrate-binding protein
MIRLSRPVSSEVNMSRSKLAVLTVVGALGLAACGSADGGTSGSGPIKIGVVAPLTGFLSPLGTGDKAAIEQEVARINADGGVLGRDLEVTIKDDKSDVPQSVTEFNQLAADRSYTAILSSAFVSASTAAGASAESNKIPTIALGPVSAFADGSNPYAFTGVAIPEVYAQAMVDYMVDQDYDTIAVGYTGDDIYGEVGNEATVEAAEEAGIDVVLDESYDQTSTDFTPLVSKVKEADPDAFLVWGAGPAPVIITKQFADSGIPLLMTGAQASQLYVEPAGAEAEGVTMTSSIAVPGRELPAGPLKDLVDGFTEPWLESEDAYPPQFAFDGATAVQLIVAAIEEAGSADREDVRDALESLDVLTPTGRFTFAEDDHAGLDTDAVAIVEVRDGDLKATPYSLERFETDLPE